MRNEGNNRLERLGRNYHSGYYEYVHDFGKPEAVNIEPFKDAQLRNGILVVSLPAKSMATLEVK